jgi:hypothetical protein
LNKKLLRQIRGHKKCSLKTLHDYKEISASKYYRGNDGADGKTEDEDSDADGPSGDDMSDNKKEIFTPKYLHQKEV